MERRRVKSRGGGGEKVEKRGKRNRYVEELKLRHERKRRGEEERFR